MAPQKKRLTIAYIRKQRREYMRKWREKSEKSDIVPVEKLKHLTKRRREYLGITEEKYAEIKLERHRELVKKNLKRVEELKRLVKRKREALGITDAEWEKIKKEAGYKEPSELKILTARKREFLGLPNGRVKIKAGGIDWVRELVRIRDNHTCQSCGKKWKEGTRRLDVHHMDRNLEGKNGRGISASDRENIDKMITLCHKCHIGLPHIRESISNKSRKLQITN